MRRTIISLEPPRKLETSHYKFTDELEKKYLNDLDRAIKDKARISEIKEAQSLESAAHFVTTV
jgi:hypothetical protein